MPVPVSRMKLPELWMMLGGNIVSSPMDESDCARNVPALLKMAPFFRTSADGLLWVAVCSAPLSSVAPSTVPATTVMPPLD